MISKLLKEVIASVAGKQFENIADLINLNEHVNEFLIAKKLNLTINQTRNILYKISNEGLVSSLRKKDKRKGWYTYYWKLDVLKSLEFLKESISQKISKLQIEIKEREKKVYYYCNRCSLEVSEEEALSTNFSCNECGNIYSIRDNTLFINELTKEINKLMEKLKVVEKEIEIEKNLLEKKKLRKLKKIEKEKQALKKAKLKITKKKISKKIQKKRVAMKKKISKKHKAKKVIKNKKFKNKKVSNKKKR
jgi:transcription factor E